MLLGGLAVLVRAELGFGAVELGAAIAIFFAVSALLSVPAGMLSDQIGPRWAMIVGGIFTATGLIGVGAVSQSWVTLLPWMAVGGVGNPIMQVASGHLLAEGVRADRQGVAYGIKQSAAPIAGVIAGIALPLIGLTAGWRATYLLAALGLIPVVLLLRGLQRPVRPRGRTPRAGDAPLLALALLSAGVGLAGAASGALTTFTVLSAVHAGLALSAAGLLLTAGSLAAVLTRVVSGWIADRLGRGALLLSSGLAGAGGLGVLGLAIGGPQWVIVIATLVAFTGGWGFQGLILLVIARTNPRAPATALGVVRIGSMTGVVVGPIAFGVLVEGPGYPVAWLVAGGATLAGSMLMLAVRPLLRPYRRAA